MFKIVNTWKNATGAAQQNRGQPAPGSGAQQTNPARRNPGETPWFTASPYEGSDSWPSYEGHGYGNPSFPVDAQRGQPVANAPGIARPAGSVTRATPDGRTTYRETRNFSRGMQRFAPITPIIMANASPGDFVPCKPRVVPNYPLGQYINNTIFFANQVIPTTIPLAGLQTQRAIAAILSTFVVYGEDQAI